MATKNRPTTDPSVSQSPTAFLIELQKLAARAGVAGLAETALWLKLAVGSAKRELKFEHIEVIDNGAEG